MTEKCSPGIRIILERIREFPEEFVDALATRTYGSEPSWVNFVGEIMRDDEAFSPDERIAVRQALARARRTVFEGAVLEMLANPPKKQALYPTSMTATAKNLTLNAAQMQIARRHGIAPEFLAALKVKEDKE